jgi:hypothetical protein
MAARAIHPQDTVISCAVCGRTLLQGEHPEIYIVNGARRHVCDLCTVRANQQGWIRESAGPQLGHRGPREERRPLLERLRARRERRAGLRTHSEAPPPEAGESLAAEEAPAAPHVEPAIEGPREPRHVHAVPTSDELKAARALELFNASEHPRTVAGVARSLGPPEVSVRASADQASQVDVLVAWELCWYRYEVDLADEGVNGVRVAAQGYELSELEPADRAANGAADEHGLLVLGA